jgi:hypothetical protein
MKQRQFKHIIGIFIMLCFGITTLGISLGSAIPTTADSSDSSMTSNIPKSSQSMHVGIQANVPQISYVLSSEDYLIITIVVSSVVSTDVALSNVPNAGIMNTSTLFKYNFEFIDTRTNASLFPSNEFTFDFNIATGIWTYTNTADKTLLGKILPTNVAIRTNFTALTGLAYSSQIVPISIPHYVIIQFTTSFDNATYDFGIRVLKATSTYFGTRSKGALNSTTATIHKFSIRENGTKIEKMSGNLNYSSTGFWEATPNVRNLAGIFYVVLTFSTDGLGNGTSTTDTLTADNSFTRTISILDYWLYFVYAGVALAIIFIIIVIRSAMKKTRDSIEGVNPTQKKEKAIEIVDISKAELKKLKLATPVKKKVKKVDESSLIFNVPTWEMDEEEVEEEPVGAETSVPSGTSSTAASSSIASSTKTAKVATSAAASSSKQTQKVAAKPSSLILHCSKCNSWYEVDEYIKIDCPKCDIGLNVAMWCNACAKWFDVPEPGNVNCPKCTARLQYNK